MTEKGKPGAEQNFRSASGPVSSPRAYFGRASRAATAAPRTGPGGAPEPGAGAAPRRPPVYRAGDPALRLFAGFALPLPPATPLTGAIATLAGIRDGEHEKLFIDLGTSLVRATPRRDQASGTLSLVLARKQNAATYGALLASLRYVNDAAAPTPGVRRVAIWTVDAGGQAKNAAATQFDVGAPFAPAAGRAAAAPGAAGGLVVIGEKQSFNTDGDYTLFWWPNRLPGAPAREAERRSPAAEIAAGPAESAGSYFSAGGRLYRLFGSAAAPAAAMPAAANDGAVPDARAGNGADRVPGRGVPPPGFERARTLRLEDVFASDTHDAIARRLLERRRGADG